MNNNTKSRLRAMRKSNPEFFTHKERKKPYWAKVGAASRFMSTPGQKFGGES